MANFQVVKLSDIDASDRLRDVDEEYALVIAQSMVEHGQIQPVVIRPTPAGKRKFKLVAGGTRYRASEINDETEIEAKIVQADKAEAQMLEIVENLFRNDLSVIDRAIFVQSYREIWEQKHGKIEPGRPGNRANLAQLLIDEAEAGSFNKHVADRMGFSVRAVKRLGQIAQNLQPALRAKLRGTPAEDNQSLLIQLAKEGPKRQAQIAAALDKEPDLKKVLDLAKEPAAEVSEIDKQRAIRAELDKSWKAADQMTQVLFVWDKLIEAGVAKELLLQVKADMEKGSR